MQDQEIIHDAYELFIRFGRKSQKILKSTQNEAEVLSCKNGDALDIVTNADMEIEEFGISMLGRDYPGFNIISEESGNHETGSEWTVYLDAVDGTKNLSWGIPLFSSSIALQHNDDIVLGVISTPYDIYTAIKGEGAFKNGRKLQVSKETELSKTVAILDTPQKKNLANDVFSRMLNMREIIEKAFYRTREYGCGSLELCYLANGKMPAVYMDITGKEPFYDVAAGLLMVEEAGGMTSNLLGEKLTKSANYVMASNGIVHKKVLELGLLKKM